MLVVEDEPLIGLELARAFESEGAIIFTASNLDYIPPGGVVPYTRPIRTACGPAEPGNAFYCSADHSIYYDANLLTSMVTDVGDFAPVVAVAHEWGHLVQHLLNRDQLQRPLTEDE